MVQKVFLPLLQLVFVSFISFVPRWTFADEIMTICYNYGCHAKTDITFSNAQIAELSELFAYDHTPSEERKYISLTIGKLYTIAGEQSPISADRGGNYEDAGVNGRMDCIDHSHNTDMFLRFIEAKGWLRYHRVIPIVKRTTMLIFDHYSAAIEQPAMYSKTFIVDSWFVDNGQPAIILPIEEWLAGSGPNPT